MEIFINNAMRQYLGTHLETTFGVMLWGNILVLCFKGTIDRPGLHGTIRYGWRLKLDDTMEPFRSTRDSDYNLWTGVLMMKQSV